jgi:hypothetical protein
MTGTNYRGWMALLTAAFPAFTGCVMEPDLEPADDRSELAGATSLLLENSCSLPLGLDPERTLAVPLLMNKTGSSSRLLVDTGWYTNALIQNTSSFLATVRLRAISTAGAQFCNVFSLGAGEAVNFRPDNKQGPGLVGIPTLPPGDFEGSMLIETDQRLAAVMMLSNIPLESMGRRDGTAAAAYQGLSMRTGSAETGQELAYPIMKNGFSGSSTTLFVQNVESWANSLQVEVRTNDARMYTFKIDVSSRQSVAIHPSDLGWTCPPGGGAPCLGSVRIVPTGARFAAIAVEHPASGVAPAILASHFENVGLAPHQQWHPVVKNQYQGASSGIGIMNVSSAEQDIEVIFRRRAAPQTPYSQWFHVLPYRTVVASPYAGTVGGFPPGEIGTAEIWSTGPITSVMNETDSYGFASSVHGGVAGDLAAPLIKIAWFGRKTRTTLWNVSSQAMQIVGKYKCHTSASGTYSSYTHTMTAAPNAVVDFEPSNIGAGNLCSAIFTTATRTLVGIVSEESMTAPPLVDGSIYEAIVLH